MLRSISTLCDLVRVSSKNVNVPQSVMAAMARKQPPLFVTPFFDGFFSNIAEQLVEKGLASVVRHKRDDEDRSPDYDKLMAAEQA